MKKISNVFFEDAQEFNRLKFLQRKIIEQLGPTADDMNILAQFLDKIGDIPIPIRQSKAGLKVVKLHPKHRKLSKDEIKFEKNANLSIGLAIWSAKNLNSEYELLDATLEETVTILEDDSTLVDDETINLVSWVIFCYYDLINPSVDRHKPFYIYHIRPEISKIIYESESNLAFFSAEERAIARVVTEHLLWPEQACKTQSVTTRYLVNVVNKHCDEQVLYELIDRLGTNIVLPGKIFNSLDNKVKKNPVLMAEILMMSYYKNHYIGFDYDVKDRTLVVDDILETEDSHLLKFLILTIYDLENPTICKEDDKQVWFRMRPEFEKYHPYVSI